MLSAPISELRSSNQELRKSIEELKNDMAMLTAKQNEVEATKSELFTMRSIETVVIDDRQIIENVLQSAKCCCCDLQIGLTLCFIWILMCSMPNYAKHWVLVIISVFQVACMIIGIICIWRAKRIGLTVAKIAVAVNLMIMLVGGVFFILYLLRLHSFDRVGNFLPMFMRIRRDDIFEEPLLMILWALVIIFNVAMQVWIIVSINRAIKAIDIIHARGSKRSEL